MLISSLVVYLGLLLVHEGIGFIIKQNNNGQAQYISKYRYNQQPLFNSMKPILTRLIEKEDLTSEETEEIWKSILNGADPIQVFFIIYYAF
jgi:hypothetical protein